MVKVVKMQQFAHVVAAQLMKNLYITHNPGNTDEGSKTGIVSAID